MRKLSLPLTIAALLAATVTSFADAPGVFVVQEGRIADPIAVNSSSRTGFGNSMIAAAGKLASDVAQTLLVGASASNEGKGEIWVVSLDEAGKLKSVDTITTRKAPLSGKLETSLPLDNFGQGIAVIKAFSPADPCATFITNSNNYQKLWAVSACRQSGKINVTALSVVDSSQVPLSGLNFTSATIGSAMAVVDTIASTKEVVVAISAFREGKTASTYEGKVLLLAIHPTSLAMRRIGTIPEKYEATDVVGATLTAGEYFGYSLASLRSLNGGKGLAVLSPRFKNASTQVGKVTMLSLDPVTYKALSATSILSTEDYSITKYGQSISSADFDHDGVTDIVVGFGLDNAGGASPIESQGAIRVALLNSAWGVKSSSYFRKGKGGFVDTGNALAAFCRFGSSVVATDFDGDLQMDVVVGSRGNDPGTTPDIAGAIWPLRMKSLPWIRKQGGKVEISGLAGSPIVNLNPRDYIGGNALQWSIAEINPPASGSFSTGKLINSGSQATVQFGAKGTNGTSVYRLYAADAGNIPNADSFRDSVEFQVVMSGWNQAPVKDKDLPRVVLVEDQADTAVLVLSKHFSDLETKSLTYRLTPLNASTSNLAMVYVSPSGTADTLHVTPFKYRFGLCSLKVEAVDQVNAFVEDTLVIEIEHKNHAPEPQDDAYSLVESKTRTLPVTANDRDVDVGDTAKFKISISKQPTHGVAKVSGLVIEYTPNQFYVGPDQIEYLLDDGNLAMKATVSLTVDTTKDPPIVYKALPNPKVQEGSAPIVVSTDSLFFSGSKRFDIDIYTPSSNCQGLATVEYSTAKRQLTLTPLPYQWGPCEINIEAVTAVKTTTKMTLTIERVDDPYQFPKNPDTVKVLPGAKFFKAFDSVDLDRDTLEYFKIDPWLGWVDFQRFRLGFQPDGKSLEDYVLVGVRKKGYPGLKLTEPTDTLKLYCLLEDPAGLRGTPSTGAVFRFDPSSRWLNIQGGQESFVLEIMGLRGERIGSISGEPRSIHTMDLSRGKGIVFLRLSEGGRTTITPRTITR